MICRAGGGRGGRRIKTDNKSRRKTKQQPDAVRLGYLESIFLSSCDLTSVNPANSNANMHMDEKELRPPQTRKHCCGNFVADANVSLFVRARNIFFRNMCVRNKCFPFARQGSKTFVLLPTRLLAVETLRATMFLQQCFLVCVGL